jgi:glycosyltransferase involved in cell wall biosynthesis
MIPITYVCDIDSPSGYSEAARLHAKALFETGGVDMKIVNHKHDRINLVLDKFWQHNLPKFMSYESNPMHRPIIIWHETPEFYKINPKQTNIAMVAWETSKIIPQWVGPLNQCDEVWTFCETAKKAFIDSGVKTPIYVFGHPVDTDKYNPDNAPLNLINMKNDCFRIMAKFQWTPRKGVEELLVSFFTEFTRDDAVQLCLFCYRCNDSEQEEQGIMNDINKYRQALRMPSAPAVFLYGKIIPDEVFPSLFTTGDIFISSSRGEGFSLPIAQAMASGKPCIVSDSTSYKDYVTSDNGWLVPTIDEPVVGMVHTPNYTGEQTWTRVKMMELRKAMRQAYNMWKDKSAKLRYMGEDARETIKRQYSPETIGQGMLDRIKELTK